jgi:hypothetical protein
MNALDLSQPYKAAESIDAQLALMGLPAGKGTTATKLKAIKS